MVRTLATIYTNDNNVNESYLFTQISTIVRTYTINGARTVYIYIYIYIRSCFLLVVLFRSNVLKVSLPGLRYHLDRRVQNFQAAEAVELQPASKYPNQFEPKVLHFLQDSPRLCSKKLPKREKKLPKKSSCLAQKMSTCARVIFSGATVPNQMITLGLL